MSYSQIISSRFYLCLKGTCTLASRALLNTDEITKTRKYLLFGVPEKHRGPHKTTS